MTPSRAQWVGLGWVMRADAQGRSSLVAGGKRCAAAMERKGWIQWERGPLGLYGWILTTAGRAAYELGQKKYGVERP